MINSYKIAEFLDKEIIGDDFVITGVSDYLDPKDGTMVFLIDRNSNLVDDFVDKKVLVLTSNRSLFVTSGALIFTDNPKLDYAKIVKKFFKQKNHLLDYSHSEGNYICGPDISLSESVLIGHGAIICGHVTIGRDVIIGCNAIINGPCQIGNSCIIGNDSILGADGFGFAYDDDNHAIRIPHLGGVIVGNNVEIGDQCHISKGTIRDTLIKDNVKINSQVRIAHNVKLGKRSIIAGGNFSGSSEVGDDCWVAPGAVVRNKVTIGNGSFVGLGAVVTKSFPPFSVLYGVPAKKVGTRDK